MPRRSPADCCRADCRLWDGVLRPGGLGHPPLFIHSREETPWAARGVCVRDPQEQSGSESAVVKAVEVSDSVVCPCTHIGTGTVPPTDL